MLLLDRYDSMCGAHAVLSTVRRELRLIARHRQIARGELRTELLRASAHIGHHCDTLPQTARAGRPPEGPSPHRRRVDRVIERQVRSARIPRCRSITHVVRERHLQIGRRDNVSLDHAV